MTTENVGGNLADHVAVRHVVDQYVDAVNAGDWTTVEGLFTDDAVWLVTSDDTVDHQRDGRRGIAAGIRSMIEDLAADVVQMNHATVITIAGDQATARSTNETLYFLPDGTCTRLFGTYHDNLVREQDGEWRFERRTFRTKRTEAEVLGLGRAADELAIRNIVARLTHLADTASSDDLNEYASLFTADATWAMISNLSPSPQERRGVEEILAAARERRAAGSQGPGSHIRHLISNHVVVFETVDTAHSRCYWQVFGETNSNQPVPIGMGEYQDEFVRAPHGWKLRRREVMMG
jgi:uncharacterized protein (TIGR02246 family)